MAIQFVGAVKREGNGDSHTLDLAALTGGIGSAAIAGDLVVAFYYSSDNTNRSENFDWPGATLLTRRFVNNNFPNADTIAQPGYKFMGETPDTEVGIAGSGYSGSAYSTIAMVFRGVDPATPLDVAWVEGYGTNAGTFTPSSITPATAGAVIVSLEGIAEIVDGVQERASDLDTADTWHYKAAQSDAGFSNFTYATLFGVDFWSGSGSWTSNATVGYAQTDPSWYSALIALRPAEDSAAELTASGLEAATELGAPSLGQVHVLAATGLDVGSELGAPGLSQAVSLSPVGLVASVNIGAPSLGQAQVLAAEPVEVSAQTGSAALGQVHQLGASGLSGAVQLGAAELHQVHQLSPAGLTISVELGAPAVSSLEPVLPPAARIAAVASESRLARISEQNRCVTLVSENRIVIPR